MEPPYLSPAVELLTNEAAGDPSPAQLRQEQS